ncbi:MAG TPA: acyltransferase family protein [Verrucomicrobiae bacterium]
MQRRYDLDWLRVFAFGLLMLFHTGMMFSTWDWHVKNIETSAAFDQVMRWVHAWRMPLLFFISGSAVWFAMDRYSTWKFFLERQKRLLLPLVFGMLVVIPPQVYLERLYHHQQYDSFWDFYPTIFTTGSYPQGNLSWHHLWYVPYIWAFSMLMLPVFVAARSRKGRQFLGKVLARLQSPWFLYLVFIPSALAEVTLRPIWPGDANNLLSDWGNFTHKLTFFVAGFVLASGTGVYDSLAAHRRKFLGAGIAAAATMILLWNTSWPGSRLNLAGYRLLSTFHVWMWLLTLLGYGRKYLSFNHGFLRYANEAVYPFYLLHQTIIIMLAYQLAYVNWGIPVKFLLVASGTFGICWGLYALAIKPWNFLRVLFGMKWRQPGTSRTAATERASSRLSAQVSTMLVPVLVVGVLAGSGCSRQQGQLLCRTLQTPSLARNVMGIADRQEIVIYLPPSYRNSQRRFPVLYFLPNFKCDLWRYTGGTFQGFRLKEAMDRQIKAGVAKEMIIVMPNAVHFLGGSWYRNSPLTGNWEDFIVRDLVTFADGQLRTIPAANARALAGHGMGGYGALELALKHPDVFGSVYAMSPAVFDEKGLENLRAVKEQAARAWQGKVEQWKNLDEGSRRKQFRDYAQGRLNSPSDKMAMEGLFISYAAAVSPDLHLPYPHIEFPRPDQTPDASTNVLPRFENGMGGWKDKLKTYQAGTRRLNAITIEFGRHDEYAWIRRGAENLSGLMQAAGIPNKLVVHEGGHESTLGKRLETAMLPELSSSLRHDP